MGFEAGFENSQWVNITDVRWEGVPETGSRATEGSGSHGGQAGWGNVEAEGGWRSESAAGFVDEEEITEVRRGEVIEGFEGEEQDFIADAVDDW